MPQLIGYDRARVLVELDLRKSFDHELWIGTESSGYSQRVIFENLPGFYSHYCKIGHFDSICFHLDPELKIKKTNRTQQDLKKSVKDLVMNNAADPVQDKTEFVKSVDVLKVVEKDGQQPVFQNFFSSAEVSDIPQDFADAILMDSESNVQAMKNGADMQQVAQIELLQQQEAVTECNLIFEASGDILQGVLKEAKLDSRQTHLPVVLDQNNSSEILNVVEKDGQQTISQNISLILQKNRNEQDLLTHEASIGTIVSTDSLISHQELQEDLIVSGKSVKDNNEMQNISNKSQMQESATVSFIQSGMKSLSVQGALFETHKDSVLHRADGSDHVDIHQGPHLIALDGKVREVVNLDDSSVHDVSMRVLEGYLVVGNIHGEVCNAPTQVEARNNVPNSVVKDQIGPNYQIQQQQNVGASNSNLTVDTIEGQFAILNQKIVKQSWADKVEDQMDNWKVPKYKNRKVKDKPGNKDHV